MVEIVRRPIVWNALRYDREFDHTLAGDLLFEEVQEYNDATTQVDQLDALVDIYFVSIGVLWKMGLNVEDVLQSGLQNTDADESRSFKDLEHWLDRFLDTDTTVLQHTAVTQLIYTCFHMMRCMGLSEDEVEQAILIVCDSNDSKSVTKTASNIKANKDKGPSFVKPESRLQLLLDGVSDAN